MTDQQSTPWRDAVTDPPSDGSIVLVSTERGSLAVMWYVPGGEWQVVHSTEVTPYSRRKPSNIPSNRPAHWMPIPEAPWDPARTQN